MSVTADIDRTNDLPEEYQGEETYRPVHALAVLSCVLGVLSVAALVDWFLLLLPLLGLFTGWLSWRTIRRNRDVYTGEWLAAGGLAASLLLGGAGAGRLGWLYAHEVPEGYRRISYELLQPPSGAPPGAIPATARELDGQKVFIKGYVFPNDLRGQTEGIREFTLVRDKGQCCFGGNPKLTDKIRVKLQGKLELTYSTGVRRLAGTFRVRPAPTTSGLVEAIYQLEADHLD
jgi:hypothetical protein